MEHISKTAQRLPDLKSPTNGSGSGPANEGSRTSDGVKRAARVWNAMTQLYGTAFLTIYGETPAVLWEAAISKLTDEQCRYGLTKLAEEARDYPANLTEFVAACKPKSAGVRFLGNPAHADVLNLPRPVANREHVNRCLANMRRNLGVEQ